MSFELLLQMDDDVLDKEMDHIFHDDDIETLSKLNPSAGELDEERKNYYRCWTDVRPQQTIIHILRVASSDDTATSEFASPASEAEPMTGEIFLDVLSVMLSLSVKF